MVGSCPGGDNSPLGQLPTRTTTNKSNHSSGPIPVRWAILLVGSCADTLIYDHKNLRIFNEPFCYGHQTEIFLSYGHSDMETSYNHTCTDSLSPSIYNLQNHPNFPPNSRGLYSDTQIYTEIELPALTKVNWNYIKQLTFPTVRPKNDAWWRHPVSLCPRNYAILGNSCANKPYILLRWESPKTSIKHQHQQYAPALIDLHFSETNVCKVICIWCTMQYPVVPRGIALCGTHHLASARGKIM